VKKHIFSGLVIAVDISQLNNLFIDVFTEMDHNVESSAVEDFVDRPSKKVKCSKSDFCNQIES
jgi:hypothetical protein